jgi:hypothetical protein
MVFIFTAEPNGYQFHPSHFERIHTEEPGVDDFMVLDAIDPVSLQEVLQPSTDSSLSDHYHQILNANPYEQKDLGYCDYDHQVVL